MSTPSLPMPDLSRMPRGARASRSLAVAAPAAVLLLLIGVWYLISYVVIDEERRFLMPPPDQVLKIAFLDSYNLQELLTALALSAQVAMIGLLLATVIGLAWAILMSQTRWLERSLYPYAVALQTIPILALVPVFGYWFGFDVRSRVLTCVLIALFPIVANSLFGLRSVDPALHDLFRLHGAGRLTRLVKLQVPAALPAVFTGLRISAGASVIGAIVGDYFFQQGEPGIGRLIFLYNRNLQPELMFGAAIVSALFGIVVFWVFGLIARRATAWHASQQSSQVPSTNRSTLTTK